MSTRLSESEIQRAVFEHLRERSMPGVEYWHVPHNQTSRRHSGYRAGVSDINAVHRGKFYALELKKPGGRASQEQLEFVAAINTAGGYACVAEGLPEALCILESWGLLRKAA